MEKPIDIPFLPESKVKTVIIDRRTPVSIQNKIRAESINIIKTPKCRELYESIASHPDILFHHIGGNEIVVAPNIYNEFKDKFKDINIKAIRGNRILDSTYPHSIAYNVGRVGNYVIHNFKYTDEVLLEKLIEKNAEFINIKQGYAKCSLCIVNNNAVITSDMGIYKKLKAYDIDVLLIRPGNIELTGLDYGFIGGCCGLINNNEILFSGDITKHPDYFKIKNFFQKYLIKVKYSADSNLIDIGSIIPITETIKQIK